MRKFASIPPRIWQSDLKAIRGDLEAIAVHYHLTTSSHATMIGLYYIPIPYLAHEIGCPLEGASKGLLRLIEAGICSYDDEKDLVWVHDMAADQIAAQLAPKDKRVKGIADQLYAFPIWPITLSFYARYRVPFHLYDERNLEEYELAYSDVKASPLEGPSMPLRSKEKEKEQEKDLGTGKGKNGSGAKEVSVGTFTRESMFEPFPVPATVTECRKILIGKGVSDSHLDECIRLMMCGNFGPFELEGILDKERNAA